MKNLIAIMIAVAVMLFLVSTNTINSTPATDDTKVVILQETSPTTPAEGEETKGGKETEEEESEEDELDYELGKVDPQTKKATRYVCEGCGEVQLQPFKCEICEKDAKKEELDVEEKNGKWYIKGTNTQVVEKEPEEEEEEAQGEEKKEGGSSGSQGGGGDGEKGGAAE